jgi:beta-lactamase class A
MSRLVRMSPSFPGATRSAATAASRMQRPLLLLAGLIASWPMSGAAQVVPDPALQSRIEERVAGFRGHVGVYVRHLETGAFAALQPDSLFPTASMVKLPLLVSLYDHFERGVLDPDTRLAYHDSLFYGAKDDGDIVNTMRPGETVTLSKLAFFMISISDNTASLWIQSLVTGADVNRWLHEHGFHATRVNSRVEGRRGDWERYGWGQTTPREMAELLVMVREGRAVSPEASEAMYRTLTNVYWGDEALSSVPATVQVASKQGAVSSSRSEALLVNATTGDYVLCIITKDQEDRSWEADNEGYLLLRDLSRIVYDHFAPRRTP